MANDGEDSKIAGADDDRLTVRFITRKWPPAVGGMEIYSRRMADALAERCAIELVTLPGRADGRAPTEVSLLLFGLKCALAAPFRPRRDVTFLGDLAIWPLGALELLFGRTRRLVIAVHGSDASYAFRGGALNSAYRLYLKLGAAFLRQAALVANSSYVAGLVERAGFRAPSVVPLGTDLHGGAAGERSDLLFVGRVSRAKGLRFLIEEVMPTLPADVRLRVAGPVWDEGERALLGHQRVDYLGSLSPTELQSEFSRAAITLVPSLVPEGFGLVAIEAAACGSQVVASNSGGLRDVVREPWGELVEPGNAPAWAGAINRRLGIDALQKAALSAAASAAADRDFRWPIVADRTIAILSARD